MEIGAGSGDFARHARNCGMFDRVIAIEPNAAILENREGLLVINKYVEELKKGDLEQSVDVACCFELLEHLSDPLSFLKCLFSLLPKGAIFFMTTPNGLGAEILELGSRSTTLGITHINLFNPQSLKKLLEKAGFGKVEITTPGILDADLLERGLQESKNGWLKYFLEHASDMVKANFQNFLKANLQSSHMQSVCEK